VAAVEQCPLGYSGARHLFEADCLRAKLNFIRAVCFRTATLVLDRIRQGTMVQLDHVGDADHPEAL